MVNVFFLPFAGGNKYSYRPFMEAAPEGIQVLPLELPGRGSRFREPLLLDMHHVTDDFYAQITPWLHEPYALYGHSMGTLAAYLLIQRILAEGHNPPLHLFVSGGAPPALLRIDDKRYLLPREAFFAKIRTYGGCPDEILRDEEMMKFFEPILRADFQALETYQHQPTLPLSVPITVLLGTDEKTTPSQGLAWGDETVSGVDVHQYPGNHFFIFPHAEEIIQLVASKVTFNTPVS